MQDNSSTSTPIKFPRADFTTNSSHSGIDLEEGGGVGNRLGTTVFLSDDVGGGIIGGAARVPMSATRRNLNHTLPADSSATGSVAAHSGSGSNGVYPDGNDDEGEGDDNNMSIGKKGEGKGSYPVAVQVWNVMR